MLPLSLRNLNPLNIRPGPTPWKGQVGISAGFVVFATLELAIRAAALLLLTYQSKYGINTIRGVISRWAPPSDDNPTESYIDNVCAVLECHPDDQFDFRDAGFLFWTILAMGHQETGTVAFDQNVTHDEISDGIALALAA